MDIQKAKRRMRVSAVVLILCLANLVRIFSDADIRSVEILSLFVSGMAFGVVVANISTYITLKKGNVQNS